MFESLFSTLVVSFIFILTEPLFLLLSDPDDTEMDREDDGNVNLGDDVDRSRTVDELGCEDKTKKLGERIVSLLVPLFMPFPFSSVHLIQQMR